MRPPANWLVVEHAFHLNVGLENAKKQHVKTGSKARRRKIPTLKKVLSKELF